MDWPRILVDRFFGFLATLIPGSAILLLFVLHKQPALMVFWQNAELGYQLKVAIVIFATFAVGYTLQYSLGKFSAGIAGAIRGAVQHGKGQTNGYDKEQSQPWRNSMWRSLMKLYLGPSAPPDVHFVDQQLLQKQLELVSLVPDENERVKRAADVMLEKSKSEVADFQWAMWWDQLHLPSLLGETSAMGIIQSHLLANFETAALVLLIAMIWTPSLRHWWIVAFCVAWFFSLVIRVVYLLVTGKDAWSSFYGQIAYLRSVTAKNDREPE